MGTGEQGADRWAGAAEGRAEDRSLAGSSRLPRGTHKSLKRKNKTPKEGILCVENPSLKKKRCDLTRGVWSASAGQVSSERRTRVCQHQARSCSRPRPAAAGAGGALRTGGLRGGAPLPAPPPGRASPQLAFLWRTFLPLSFTGPLLFLG